MKNQSNPLMPGWFIQLTGHEFDFLYWERALSPPFDPWCERIPRSESCVWALRSRSFENLQNAAEVRERAIPLIQRLNGALGVEVSAEALTLNSVGRIDDQGGIQFAVFAEVHLRGRTMATAEGRDAKGNVIPPPLPNASVVQKWIAAAEEHEDIADLLVFAGRADNWFDIYKTLELAETLAGGQPKLRTLLGDARDEYERMRRTANCYRHASYSSPPKVLTTLTEARPLLSVIVRAVLDRDES
jgi:hypothetical protein